MCHSYYRGTSHWVAHTGGTYYGAMTIKCSRLNRSEQGYVNVLKTPQHILRYCQVVNKTKIKPLHVFIFITPVEMQIEEFCKMWRSVLNRTFGFYGSSWKTNVKCRINFSYLWTVCVLLRQTIWIMLCSYLGYSGKQNCFISSWKQTIVFKISYRSAEKVFLCFYSQTTV